MGGIIKGEKKNSRKKAWIYDLRFTRAKGIRAWQEVREIHAWLVNFHANGCFELENLSKSIEILEISKSEWKVLKMVSVTLI
jgi:hypothetical protein